MITIPFTKLHGAENDFLLTWNIDIPPSAGLEALARRICARNTGIGADGWMIVERVPHGLRTRLFNSDGSEAEISGNGTRCAAAFALRHTSTDPQEIVVNTAAGPKTLRLTERRGNSSSFEMDMGLPVLEELDAKLDLAGASYSATILNVGNPQCVIFVNTLPIDWLSVARQAESHPRFPKHSNVSFVIVRDSHTVEAVFFERGAGETRSSGTGSTGAAAAAILRKVCQSPVEVQTPAGNLHLRWDKSVYLTGPAELVGEGKFFLDD